MDPISNYPTFKEDILQTFAKLIVEFKMQIHQMHEGCYELRSANSILRFSYDKGDVYCTIRESNLEDKLGYGIFSVLTYLNPEAHISRKYNTPILQLINYSEIIDLKLRKIVSGDFSWTSGYSKSQERLRKMTRYLWENIENTNPIFIKFSHGDLSWQNDLEEYLSRQGINLN